MPNTPIRAGNLPKPAWSREWQEPGASRHHRGLYPIQVANGPTVGVRVSIDFYFQAHLEQSAAMAELFDGTHWSPVAGLRGQHMRCGDKRTGVSWMFDEEGQRSDIARLLEDVRLAYSLRAPGPAEFAEDNRTIVTHDVGVPVAVDALHDPVVRLPIDREGSYATTLREAVRRLGAVRQQCQDGLFAARNSLPLSPREWVPGVLEEIDRIVELLRV